MDFSKKSLKNEYEKRNSVNPCKKGVSRDFSGQESQNKAKNEPFYFLNIFKPCSITSFDVIYRLRKRLKIKKIGHSGTLDPLAYGVMQVGVGKATRLLDYLGSDKKYVAKIRFGYLSSTCDAEGDITFFNIPKFTRDELLAALNSLTGQIEQIPPAYSAVKVGGKKLCDLVRQKTKKTKGVKNEGFENIEKPPKTPALTELQMDNACLNPYIALNEGVQKDENSFKSGILNVFSTPLPDDPGDACDPDKRQNSLLRNINENLLDIEIPKRIVTIYEAKLLNFVTPQDVPPKTPQKVLKEAPEEILFQKTQEVPPKTMPQGFFEAEIEISCSKGTYIRSFAVDLAQKLGTGAYLTSLTRIRAGNFDIKNSIQIDEVDPEINAINPCAALDLPKYELNEDEYKKVLNGVSFRPKQETLNGVSFPAWKKPKNEEKPKNNEKQENNEKLEKREDVNKLHNDIDLPKTLSGQHFMLIFQNNLVSIAVLSDNNFVCKKVFK